jgi:hypothetical protein
MVNEKSMKKIQSLDIQEIEWKVKPAFKLPKFWKPSEGNYVVEADFRQLNIHEGKFGKEILLRIKVNGKEFLWSIPVVNSENNVITVAPNSRAFQLKEIIEKYGLGFHKLFVKVTGESRGRKYTIEHLPDCGCKKESKNSR